MGGTSDCGVVGEIFFVALGLAFRVECLLPISIVFMRISFPSCWVNSIQILFFFWGFSGYFGAFFLLFRFVGFSAAGSKLVGVGFFFFGVGVFVWGWLFDNFVVFIPVF